jgi:TRAP-type C4-dicarboxylate transport system substrate-binding protein
MIRVFKSVIILVMGFGIFCLTPIVSYANEKPITLIYNTYLKESFSCSKTVSYWMDEVLKRTNGQIKFKTYYDGTLLSGRESFPGCGRGLCDMTMIGAVYTNDVTPLSSVCMTKCLTENMDSFQMALRSFFSNEKLVIDEFSRNKVHLLMALPVGLEILGAKEKVTSLEGIKNLRVRSMGDSAAAFKKLGATPVGLSLSEVYDGIDKGVVDAYGLCDFTLATNFRFYEAAPYMIDAGLGMYGVLWVTINKRQWDGLSKDIKQIMNDVAGECVAKHTSIYEELEGKMVDIAHKGGAKIVVFSDEEKTKMRDVVGKNNWKQWVESMEAKGLKGAYIFDKWKTLVEKENLEGTYKSPFKTFAERYGVE